jgi:hypothetical protein
MNLIRITKKKKIIILINLVGEIGNMDKKYFIELKLNNSLSDKEQKV